MEEKKGITIVMSGPSGTGKSTIINAVRERGEKFWFSVSMTTRAPRPNEVDGKDYIFTTREHFDELVEQGAFLEHAEFAGNCYGTPLEPIKKSTDSGSNVLLDIEVNGVKQVKELLQEAVYVLVIPPSVEELENRLRKRGTDSEEMIQARLKQSIDDLQYAGLYDYIIINDKVEDAADDFLAVIKSARCMIKNRINFIENFKK